MNRCRELAAKSPESQSQLRLSEAAAPTVPLHRYKAPSPVVERYFQDDHCTLPIAALAAIWYLFNH